jgi:hypothetical protein
MKTKRSILVAVAVLAVMVGGIAYVVAGGGGDRRLGTLSTSAISGYEVNFKAYNVNGLSKGTAAARCSAGKKVLGGGVRYSDMNVLESSPAGDVGGWEVTTYNGGVFQATARVYAVCAHVG